MNLPEGLRRRQCGARTSSVKQRPSQVSQRTATGSTQLWICWSNSSGKGDGVDLHHAAAGHAHQHRRRRDGFIGPVAPPVLLEDAAATNVLVYAFDKSKSPKKRVAQRLMNELMDEDRLRVSTQVLQELFVTLTRKVSRRCSSEEALAVLEDLSAWPLMVVDYAAIRAAAGLAETGGPLASLRKTR
jgi:hypothetical protein